MRTIQTQGCFYCKWKCGGDVISVNTGNFRIFKPRLDDSISENKYPPWVSSTAVSMWWSKLLLPGPGLTAWATCLPSSLAHSLLMLFTSWEMFPSSCSCSLTRWFVNRLSIWSLSGLSVQSLKPAERVMEVLIFFSNGTPPLFLKSHLNIIARIIYMVMSQYAFSNVPWKIRFHYLKF